MLGRVSFSGDGVAGLEKIVGGYYRMPRAGRERGGPTFPATWSWRTRSLRPCDWLTFAGEQPSHANRCCYTFTELRPRRHSIHFGTPDRSEVKSRIHTAISCGWSASQGSRPSPLRQAAHQAGHTHQRRGNHSNCHRTQYRVALACLRGPHHFLSHRWAARLTAYPLRRVCLDLLV